METTAYFLDILKRDFDARRLKNESFGLRAYAKFLGVNATSLSRVLKGERPLPLKSSKMVMDKLGLEENQRKAFVASIVSERKYRKEISPEVLEEQLINEEHDLKVLCEWEYTAVLNLLKLELKDYSSRAIADRLGISLAKTVESINFLLKEGHIEEVNQKFVRTALPLTSTNDIPSTIIQKAHVKGLQLAAEKISKVPVQKREFLASTMAINSNKIDQAKKMIRKFEQELATLLEDGQENDVYRFGIQLFPLTNKNNEETQNEKTN